MNDENKVGVSPSRPLIGSTAGCEWTYFESEYESYWETGCEKLFEITEGTPSENGMRFCCYCGKPLSHK